MTRDFITVLRGYDKRQVDSLLDRAAAALATGGNAERAAARDALRAAEFDLALRGYDRHEVDTMVQQLLLDLGTTHSDDDLRQTLASVLRVSPPTDQAIIEEARRLRALADQHQL